MNVKNILFFIILFFDVRIYSLHQDQITFREHSFFNFIQNHDLVRVQNTLKYNVDPNCKMQDKTALMVAIICGNYEIIEAIVKAGADLNIQNDLGETALIIAVKKKFLKVVNLLLLHNADINIRDNKNKSPLEIARSKSYEKICEAIIEYQQKKFKELNETTELLPAVVNIICEY